MYALEAEHCKKPDSKKEFTSANGLTTTSQLEWEIVAKPREERDYPERDGFKVSPCKFRFHTQCSHLP